MRHLDAGGGYRDQIERDLDARLAHAHGPAPAPAVEPGCPSCHTVNDPDARFCKSCGQKL